MKRLNRFIRLTPNPVDYDETERGLCILSPSRIMLANVENATFALHGVASGRRYFRQPRSTSAPVRGRASTAETCSRRRRHRAASSRAMPVQQSGFTKACVYVLLRGDRGAT
jgi:hypothetical protein